MMWTKRRPMTWDPCKAPEKICPIIEAVAREGYLIHGLKKDHFLLPTLAENAGYRLKAFRVKADLIIALHDHAAPDRWLLAWAEYPLLSLAWHVHALPGYYLPLLKTLRSNN